MRTLWVGVTVLIGGWIGSSTVALGQVYGYTDDNGVLILSNVPSDTRMGLIAEGNPEQAGKVWRYSGQFDALILEAASYARLDSALIKAVIAIESGFNRFAKSHKGAMGLMQLMPDTCKRYGVVNPYDARQNVRAGSRHLRDLLDEFDDVHLSLAAYNAGATPVRRYGNIPPYRETRDYVRKVMAVYRAGSKVSITKGGKTYTIRPGGKTQIKSAPAGSTTVRSQTKVYAPGEGASLGQIAAANRRAGQRTVADDGNGDDSVATARPREAQAIDDQSEPTVAPPSAVSASSDSRSILERSLDTDETGLHGDGPFYYRYKDANGVIYITRDKPENVEYEVLRR